MFFSVSFFCIINSDLGAFAVISQFMLPASYHIAQFKACPQHALSNLNQHMPTVPE